MVGDGVGACVGDEVGVAVGVGVESQRLPLQSTWSPASKQRHSPDSSQVPCPLQVSLALQNMIQNDDGGDGTVDGSDSSGEATPAIIEYDGYLG